jgi:hypothetical protein
MDQTEIQGQQANQPVDVNQVPTGAPSPSKRTETMISPQGNGQTCATCGSAGGTNPADGTNYAYVYALGRVEPRFPNLSVEKEFAQATGRSDTGGLTDRQAVHAVISQRPNRYLARQMCQ